MARVQGMTPDGIRKAISEAIAFIADLNVEDLNKLLAAFEDANGIFDVRLVEAQEAVKEAGAKALEAEASARVIIDELAKYEQAQAEEVSRILGEVAVAVDAANLASAKVPDLLARLELAERSVSTANSEVEKFITKQDEFLAISQEQVTKVGELNSGFQELNQAVDESVTKVDEANANLSLVSADLDAAKASLDAKTKQNELNISAAQAAADSNQNAISDLNEDLSGLSTKHETLTSSFSAEVEKLEKADASLLTNMNTKVGDLSATTAAQSTAISAAKTQADKGVADASAASFALANYKTVNDPRVAQAQKDADKGIEDATEALTRANTAAGQLPGMNTAISSAAAAAKKANDALPAIRTDITNVSTRISTATGNLTSLGTDVASKVAALQAMDQSQAGEISTTKSKIDNLQIGGRNLARRRRLSGDSQYQTVIDTGEKFWTGEPIYYGEKLTSGTPPTSLHSNIRIEPGETYTISMWIRGETDGGKTNANILFYDAKLLKSHASTPTGGPASEWYLISATVHNDTDTAYESVATYFYINRNPGEKTWFTSPKLERGNKATDWTPAPEDVDASVAKAQLEAETARLEAVSKSNEARVAAELKAKELADKAKADAEVEAAKTALEFAQQEATKAKDSASSDAADKLAAAEVALKAYTDAEAAAAQEGAELTAAIDALNKANKAQADAETTAATLATAAKDAAATALNTYKGVNDPKVTKAQTDATKAIGDAKAASDKLPAMVTATSNAAAAAKKANDALPAIRTDISGLTTSIGTTTGNLTSLGTDVASKVAALQAMDQAQAISITAAQKAADQAALDATNKSAAAKTAAEAYAKEQAEAAQAKAEENSAVEALRVAEIEAAAAKAAAATDAKDKADEAERLAKVYAAAQAKSAKETAEANAALDATNKANKAKTDAEANAKVLSDKAQQAAEGAQSSIDNLEIGARNLLLGSAMPKHNSTAAGITSEMTPEGLKIVADPVNQNFVAFSRSVVGPSPAGDALKDGDKVTFSIEIKSEDSTYAPAFYAKPGMSYLQMNGKVGTEFTKVYVTRTWVRANVWNLHLGFQGKPGTYIVRNFKLERGDRATDWTPAPEEIDASVAKAQLEAETARAEAESKSQAAQTAAELYAKEKSEADTAASLVTSAAEALRVAKLQADAAKASAATDAKDKADEAERLAKVYAAAQAKAAKEGAEATAALDATTKADKAKTDAEAKAATLATAAQNAAATALNTYKGVNDPKVTKAQTDATKAIGDAKVAADKLPAMVTATANAAAEAKKANDALPAIRMDISGLTTSIGTTTGNLTSLQSDVASKVSALQAMDQSQAGEISTAKTQAAKGISDAATAKTAIDNLQIGGRNLLLRSQPYFSKADVYDVDSYTLAMAPEAGELVTITIYGSLPEGRTGWGIYNSGTGGANYQEIARLISPGVYSLTFSWKSANSNTYVRIYSATSSVQAKDNPGLVRLDRVKLERGNKPTDWTPAPEDVDLNIKAALDEAKAATGALPAINTSLSDAASKANQAVAALPGLTTGVTNAQKSADDTLAYAQVISQRGDNLIPNGFGELKSNKYFENFEYIPDDSPIGAYGSFETKTSGGSSFGERISVDPIKPLTASLWVKKLTEPQRAYFAIEPYDADDLMISPQNWMETTGTRAQLAKPLKKGDTEMHLVDASTTAAWAGSNMRGVTVWNYVDKQGKLWPPGTYSRNHYSSMYQPEGVNGNVITFIKPWGGVEAEAGTWVGNGRSGGSYLYPWTAMVSSDDWTYFEGIVGGSIAQGMTLGNGMPAATVAVRSRILLTPVVAPIRVAGLSLTYTKTIFNSLEKAKAEVSALNTKAAELTTGLSNAATQDQYNTLNTRLWGNQGEINGINDKFQTQQNQINANNAAFQTWQTDINTKRGKWEDGATLALQHLTDFTTRQTKWNKASTDATKALTDAATAQKAFSDNQTKWNLASSNATKALADLTTEQGKVLALQNELNLKRDKWESGATLAIDNLTGFATKQTKWNKASTDATKALTDAATAQKAFSDNQTKWNLASSNATKALADLTTEQGKVLGLQNELNLKRDKWESGATLAIDNLTNFSTSQTKWNKASTDATQALTNAAAAQKVFNDNQTKWNLASSNATKALGDLATEQSKVLGLQNELNLKRDKWESGATLAIDNLTNFSTRQTKWNKASTDATKALSDASAAQTAATSANTKALQGLTAASMLTFPHLNVAPNDSSGRPWWSIGMNINTILTPPGVPEGTSYYTSNSSINNVDPEALITVVPGIDYKVEFWTAQVESGASGAYVHLLNETKGSAVTHWADITDGIPSDIVWKEGAYAGGSISSSTWVRKVYLLRVDSTIEKVALKLWPGSAASTNNRRVRFWGAHLSAFMPIQEQIDSTQTAALASHAALFEGQNKWNEVASSAIQAQATLLAKQDRWSDGVTKALAWQDQLNNSQSDINKTTTSVLANQSKWNLAQAEINNAQSDTNRAVKSVLDNQDKWNLAQAEVNNAQSVTNKAIKLVNDNQAKWNTAVTQALNSHNELFVTTSSTFKAVKAVNDNQGKWNKVVSDLVSTNSAVSNANTTAIEGLTRVLGLTHGSANIVPMVPGGVRTGGTDIAPVFTPMPAWMEFVRRVTVTTIPDIPSMLVAQELKTASPSSGNYVSEVDPTIEYKYSYWVHANVTGTRIYIEVRDQDGALALASNTPDNHTTSTGHLAGNVAVATGWQKNTGVITFKPNVRAVRIAKVYYNHSNGVVGTQSLADIQIYPNMPSQTDVNKALLDSDAAQNTLLTKQGSWNDAASRSIATVENLWGKTTDDVGVLNILTEELGEKISQQSSDFAKNISQLFNFIPRIAYSMDGQNVAASATDGFIKITRTKSGNQTTKVAVEAVGGWVGSMIVEGDHGQSGGQDQTFLNLTPIRLKLNVNSGTRIFNLNRSTSVDHIGAVKVTFFVDPGEVRAVYPSGSNVYPDKGSWRTLHTEALSAAETSDYNLSLNVTWAATTYNDQFGIRIRVGSTVVAVIQKDRVGPLLPGQDGVRVMSLQKSQVNIKAGTRIYLEAYSTAGGSTERRVAKWHGQVSYITSGRA